MTIHSVAAVYFSATNTTKTVAERIAKHVAEKLGVPHRTVDFTLPAARQQAYRFASDELVIFGVPVYAGRIPNLILPFVQNGFTGDSTPAVPIVLYGNRNYDDALIELRNELENNHFRTISAGAFIGEHSFSRILGAHRPDTEDLKLVDRLADKIAERIQNEELPTQPIPVRGCEPIRPYYTPRDRVGNPVNILKVKPKTSDACIKCGLCIRLCPMGSIAPEDPSHVPGKCIKCCACVKACPVGAKYYDDEKYLYHQHELEEGFTRRAEPELFY